jgi:hypothetical protein
MKNINVQVIFKESKLVWKTTEAADSHVKGIPVTSSDSEELCRTQPCKLIEEITGQPVILLVMYMQYVNYC